MNVMLNIPAEAGTDRAGKSARRSGDAKPETDDFRALFDQVAQAGRVDRSVQTGPAPAAAKAADNGEADLTRPRASERHEENARAATQPAAEEAASDGPGGGRAADSRGEGRAIDPPLPDMDGPTARAKWRPSPDTGRAAAGKSGRRQETVPADPRAAPSVTTAAAPPAAAKTDRPQHADRDAARDPVIGGRSRPDNKNDGTATPAGPAVTPSVTAVAIPPAAAEAGEPLRTDRDAARAPATRGQFRPGRKDEREAMPADARMAVPASTAAAPPVAVARAESDTGDGEAKRADDGVAVRPVLTGKSVRPARGTAGNGTHTARSDGREAQMDTRQKENAAAVSAASPKPAAATAQAGSGQVRDWVRSDSVMIFAPPAIGEGKAPVDGSPDAPQADRGTPPSRGADQPIGVRVAAYERHLAPLAAPLPPGGTPTAMPSDGGSDGTAAPAAAPEIEGDGVRQVAAGSMEMPRAPRREQDWQTDPIANRGQSPATAKAPAERRIAAENDPIGAPDSARRSGYDRPEGLRDRPTGPLASAPPAQLGEKRPVAVGLANTSSPASAAPVSTAAPAAPLTAGVASGIVSALAAAPAAAAPAAAPQRLDSTGTPVAAEPVRTITLNLDMQEHGQVDLRISLKGNAVSIQVKADRAETADTLARDDTALREALHRAGYETQQVQIDRRDGAPTRLGDAASSGQQQPAGGAGGGASSGHALGGQRAPQPQPRPQPQRDASVLPDQDTHDAPRQDRYRGPDRLYV